MRLPSTFAIALAALAAAVGARPGRDPITTRKRMLLAQVPNDFKKTLFFDDRFSYCDNRDGVKEVGGRKYNLEQCLEACFGDEDCEGLMYGKAS